MDHSIKIPETKHSSQAFHCLKIGCTLCVSVRVVCVLVYEKSRFNFSFFINIIFEDSFRFVCIFVYALPAQRKMNNQKKTEPWTVVNKIRGILLSFLWCLTTAFCNCFGYSGSAAHFSFFNLPSCQFIRSITFRESVISKWHEVIAPVVLYLFHCLRIVCVFFRKSINLQRNLLLSLLRTTVQIYHGFDIFTLVKPFLSHS